MINFAQFKLEYHTNCNYDFLQIHDGASAGSHMIGRFCGTSSPLGGTFNSTHNQMYFWFHSDASVTNDGFEVIWHSALPGMLSYRLFVDKI